MSPSLLVWAPVAIAAVGAVYDLRERRLPNLLCAVLAVVGLAFLGVIGGFTAIYEGVLHAALALLIGMLLFRLGTIGGGDAKFYAAAACSVPFSDGLWLLGWTSVSGLVLLVVMLVKRVFSGRSRRGGLSLRGWEVPYGVAIAGGLMLTLLG